jgi:hypothetical protein
MTGLEEATTMPQRYRIRHAQSADEVLSELGKFMDYVNSGPVISLLPSTLQNISSRNATDVAKWHEQIERDLRTTLPMSATARFWLNVLDEVLKGARQRLDELGGSAAAPADRTAVKTQGREC